jgi:hypothetical protein
MSTTVIVGQLDYQDAYGSGGGRTGNYLWPHRLLGYATAGAFAAAATYALLAAGSPTEPHRNHAKIWRVARATRSTSASVSLGASGSETVRSPMW